MKNLLHPDIDCWRMPLMGEVGDDGFGAFTIPYGEIGALNVIASTGGGWDHVSVSTRHRCPTWEEMDYVKRLFFKPEEAVMQLHPAEADHINLHPYCLHLWRPQTGEIPLPPKRMV